VDVPSAPVAVLAKVPILANRVAAVGRVRGPDTEQVAAVDPVNRGAGDGNLLCRTGRSASRRAALFFNFRPVNMIDPHTQIIYRIILFNRLKQWVCGLTFASKYGIIIKQSKDRKTPQNYFLINGLRPVR
jgi:hypothetical protein